MPVALVTGTSTGIGKATSIALAKEGFVVYAGMRDLATSKNPLAEVSCDEDARLTTIQMDVDSDQSVDEAITNVLRAEGHIDVLVNNAGIGNGQGSVEETSLADFRQVMETNFFGALRCTKAVLPGMRQQRSGCIVMVSSIAGRIALAPHGAYAASKWALEGVTECLAQGVKCFNIRVALIEPSGIDTAIVGKAPPLIDDSPYPHAKWMKAVHAATFAHAVSPDLVADQIAAIAKGEDDGKLRYPVGPTAEPFLYWRRKKSDEEFVAFGVLTDAEFLAAAKAELGLDLKL